MGDEETIPLPKETRANKKKPILGDSKKQLVSSEFSSATHTMAPAPTGKYKA